MTNPPLSTNSNGTNDEEMPDTSNIFKSRDFMYKLIISQLLYDGHQSVATALQQAVQVETNNAPSDRLFHLTITGLEHEPGFKERPKAIGFGSNNVGSGLDLEFETESNVPAPEPALYETAYVTSHKGNCRAGCFSSDGQLIATGSVDASIKILDVDRMLAKSAPDEMDPSRGEQQGHPVIRTLYDHMEEVSCLEFHPKEPFLCSGSKDMTVKLFDISKASVKKAFKTITEAEPVQAISFHPLGDYLIVATSHPVIRMYDLNTLHCYVCAFPKHQHTATVTNLKWSPDAKLFASCSKDGNIKIWDAVSNKCINTLIKAHDGLEVCSVVFSKNGKYLLSSGKNSICKLWELTTSRCLITYTGAGTTGKQEYEAQAVFNHTEDYVLFPDEATTSLCAWNSRTASRKQLMSLGHNGAVRLIAHSPTQAAFLTCSDDFRARFWYRRTPTL
ncbi:cleavage stimulation factor subunit 1 [Diorhabda carinulata]|uniref:cleavage stimulation factor subunit 1 n=1 Tax=Diorhabda sublineata TaxID=1163346 RepID=UPI0024E05B74|nr:cleavage stimulation factor subunit 1 [Diorhabda sublineata]XP_057653151.1 cleavage stimulation factor subunit 1 [Diorhabda carinulata]